ncbi:MAG: SDR family oxidoreductase [Ardenticatenaceae bacterium]|nr:SDR family oxidoreductase [Ardenticatenaceae bacterium]
MQVSSFDLTGHTAVVTGGSGTLGSAAIRTLLGAGARVALLARNLKHAQKVAQTLAAEPNHLLTVGADVTQPDQLERAAEQIATSWGEIHILVNFAGGNRPAATVNAQQTFFDLSPEALSEVVNLNLLGTVYACQVFGRQMAEQRRGSIVNISSMAAVRPLTRVVAYGAAKAGVENVTRWLAVYMAQEFSPAIRVNAIAPGFFLGEQNRALLVNTETGEPTPRGQAILQHTPMARFGDAVDLGGTLLWLASSASSFVTGIVVPVDGGFSAFSGV